MFATKPIYDSKFRMMALSRRSLASAAVLAACVLFLFHSLYPRRGALRSTEHNYAAEEVDRRVRLSEDRLRSIEGRAWKAEQERDAALASVDHQVTTATVEARREFRQMFGVARDKMQAGVAASARKKQADLEAREAALKADTQKALDRAARLQAALAASQSDLAAAQGELALLRSGKGAAAQTSVGSGAATAAAASASADTAVGASTSAGDTAAAATTAATATTTLSGAAAARAPAVVVPPFPLPPAQRATKTAKLLGKATETTLRVVVAVPGAYAVWIGARAERATQQEQALSSSSGGEGGSTPDLAPGKSTIPVLLRLDDLRRLELPPLDIALSTDTRAYPGGGEPLVLAAGEHTVTVQNTYPRINAAVIVEWAELRPAPSFSSAASFISPGSPTALSSRDACPVTPAGTVVLPADLFYDDEVEDEYLQDDKHSIKQGPEDAYVARLKLHRTLHGGHALSARPNPKQCHDTHTSTLDPITGDISTHCVGKDEKGMMVVFDRTAPKPYGRVVTKADLKPEHDVVLAMCGVEKPSDADPAAVGLHIRRLAHPAVKRRAVTALLKRSMAGAGSGSGVTGSGGTGTTPLPPPLSVLMLVLDSVSRPVFYAALPKVVEALRQISSRGGAAKEGGGTGGGPAVYDFRRHHVTGGGTSGNVPALLAGLALDDVDKEDHASWLFYKAKRLGYATMYASEECSKDKNAISRIMEKSMEGYGHQMKKEDVDRVFRRSEEVADHTLNGLWCHALDYGDMDSRWYDMGAQL